MKKCEGNKRHRAPEKTCRGGGGECTGVKRSMPKYWVTTVMDDLVSFCAGLYLLSVGRPKNAAEADSTTPLPQPPRSIGAVSRGGYDVDVGGAMVSKWLVLHE